MPISFNNSGTWQIISQPYFNNSGIWTPAKNMWVNISGVWKLVYTAMIVALNKYSDSTSIANYIFWDGAGSNPASVPHATMTVTGGTAPITMTLTKKSGTAAITVSNASSTYGSGVWLTTNNGSTGVAVFTVTATDANGIAVDASDFTVTVT